MYDELLEKLTYLIDDTAEGKDNSELILTMLNYFLLMKERDPEIWKKLSSAIQVQLDYYKRRDKVISIDRDFIDENFRIIYNMENDLELMEKEHRYINDFPEQVRNYLSYRVYMPELGRPNQQIYEED